MKVLYHFRSPLLWFFPPWVSGVTLGRHIFFRRRREAVSPETLRHELIHVCQYVEVGFWRFLWRYVWKERHVSYREKSFEREAYDHQHDPAYRRQRWPLLRLRIPEEADP